MIMFNCHSGIMFKYHKAREFNYQIAEKAFASNACFFCNFYSREDHRQ